MSDAPLSFSVDTAGLVAAEQQADKTTAALLKVADATDKVEKTMAPASARRRTQYDIMAEQATGAAKAIDSVNKAATAPGMTVLAQAVSAAAGAMPQATQTAVRLRTAIQEVAQAHEQAAPAVGRQRRETDLLYASQQRQNAELARAVGLWVASAGPVAIATAGVVALAAAYLYSGKAMAEMVEKQELIERRLTAGLGNTQVAALAYRDIGKYATETGQSVDVATEKFLKLNVAVAGLSASRQQVVDLASATDKLASLSGANPSERSAAQGALVKMLSDSKVQASELKSVLSSVPSIADEIARGLGVSVLQLRMMAQDGQLTNDMVFKGLLARQKEISAEFDKMPRTVGQTFQAIGNDVGAVVTRFALLLPMVRDFKLLLDGAAAASAFLNRATTPDTAQQRLATATSRIESAPRLSGGNVLMGNNAYSRDFYGSRADVALDDNADTMSQLAAKAKSIQGEILNALDLAGKLDPVAARLKAIDEQSVSLNKTLADLNSGMSGLPADVVAEKSSIIMDALRRLRIEADNTGSAYDKAWKAVTRVEEQNERNLTPAQRSIEDRTKALVDTGSATKEAAGSIIDRQNLLTVKELVEAKEREAQQEEALTVAMKNGKAAMTEAAMAAALLDWQLKNLGASTEEAEVAMDVLAERYAIAVGKITGEQNKRGGANANKGLLDELNSVAAAMKVVEQGAYAMRRAEAEAKASRATDGTGKLQLEVFDAKQGLTDSTLIANLKVEIELTKQLAAAAGDVSKQKQIQLDADIARATREAGPGSRGGVADAMRERAEAEKNRNLAEGTAALEKQIELAQQEAAIIRSGSAEYAIQVAMLQKKRDLIQAGVDISGTEATRQISLAGELARVQQETRIAQAAADEQKRIWQSAFDGIQRTGANVFFDIFSGAAVTGKSVAESMKNIFLRAFAEIAAAAIIRPLIQPIISAGQSIGIVPGGVGGFGGMPGTSSMGGLGGQGGFGGALGNMSNSIGRFMQTPIASSFQNIDSEIANWSTYGTQAQNSMSGPAGFLGNTTWSQGLGAAAGIGAGAYKVATSKSTSDTLGGVGMMVGSVVSMLPIPGAQIVGPLIMAASAILPGLFGGDEKPKLPPLAGANVRFDYGATGYNTTSTQQNGGASISGDMATIPKTIQGLFDSTGGTVTDPSKVFGAAVWKNYREGTTSTYLLSPTQGSNQLSEGGGDATAAISRLIAKAFQNSVTNGALSDVSPTIMKALTNKELTSVEDAQRAIEGSNKYDEVIRDKPISESEKTFKSIAESMKQITAFATEFGLAVQPLADLTEKKSLKVATDFADSIQRALDDMVDPAKGMLADLEKQKQSIIDENAYILETITGAQDQILKIEELYGKKRAEIVEQSLSSINALIERVTTGDLSLSSPTNSLAKTESKYQEAAQRALSGDSSVVGTIGNEATTYLENLLRTEGSTSRYFRELESVRATLQTVVSMYGANSTGMPGGMTPSAASAANDRQISDLTAANKLLADKFDRLMNAVAGFIGADDRARLFT